MFYFDLIGLPLGTSSCSISALHVPSGNVLIGLVPFFGFSCGPIVSFFPTALFFLPFLAGFAFGGGGGRFPGFPLPNTQFVEKHSWLLEHFSPIFFPPKRGPVTPGLLVKPGVTLELELLELTFVLPGLGLGLGFPGFFGRPFLIALLRKAALEFESSAELALRSISFDSMRALTLDPGSSVVLRLL